EFKCVWSSDVCSSDLTHTCTYTHTHTHTHTHTSQRMCEGHQKKADIRDFLFWDIRPPIHTHTHTHTHIHTHTYTHTHTHTHTHTLYHIYPFTIFCVMSHFP